MDILERAGNFFTGGGWSSNTERSKSDAERKKREEEERKRREAAAKKAAEAQAKQPSVAQRQQTAMMDALSRAPKGEAAKPTPAPQIVRPTLPTSLTVQPAPTKTGLEGLSAEDTKIAQRLQAEGKQSQAFIERAREANKAQKLATYENSPIGKILNTAGEAGKSIAQGFARFPETVVRSALIEPLAGNATRSREKAVNTDSDVNTGLRKFLYGEAPVQSYQSQARDIQSGVKQFTDSDILANAAVFVAPLLAGLDLVTGGKGKAAKTAAEDVFKEAEKKIGRQLTDVERNTVQAEVERQMKKDIVPEVDIPSKAPTVEQATPETKDVAESYKDVYNTIVQDTKLTPEERTGLIQEARNRHKELLKQVDQRAAVSKEAQDQVIAQADEVAQVQATQQADEIAALQAQQAEAIQPIPEQVVQDTQEVPIVNEVDVNDAYKVESVNSDGSRSGEDYEVRYPSQEKLNDYRSKKQTANEQGSGFSSGSSDIVVVDAEGNELQRIPFDDAVERFGTDDRAELSHLIANGGAPRGNVQKIDASNGYQQTEQMLQRAEEIRTAQKKTPKDLITSVARQLYDPQTSGQKLDNDYMNLLRERGELQEGQTSLLPSQSITFQTSVISNPNQATESIARQNGVADVIKAQAQAGTQPQFDTYRIYKDELWRMANGDNNTLPVDPTEMARYVRDMESANPQWIEQNATLRQVALDNFRQRVEAGTDSREMYEASAQNPFYTPRRQVKVEDANSPTISSIFNRSGKSTRQRQEGQVGAVESPIDLFIDDIRNTVVGQASQRRAQLLRDLGFEVTQSAEEAVMRRDIIKQVTDLSELRERLAGEVKSAKGNTKKAESAIKKAENNVVSAISKMLDKAKKDSDDIYNDVVARDPRYDVEKKAILNQKFTNLTPKEAKEQIKYDLEQLDKLYPAPEQMKRDQILEFARSLGGESRTADELAKADDALATSQAAREEIDALRAMMRQAKEEGGELWEELRNYEINPRTGQTEVTYKADGVSGKIAIPPSLATEWSNLDSSFDASAVNRILGGIGGIQKTFWTGMFNPVFQVLSTIRNFGQMFTNAEGLSAFNPTAIGQFYKSLFSTKGNNSFRNMLAPDGAQYENSTKSIMLRRSIADDIVNQSSFKEFMLRNPIRVVSDVARIFNDALAHVSNAQRDQVMAGAMARYKAMGWSDEAARQGAITAATKVFGDFNRVSRFARILDDTLLPYAGATQAGIRADVRAFKERPAETAAKYGLMIGAMGGIVGWNLQQGAGEYYKTMKEEGRETDYENNLVLAIGDVSRNEDGSWNGLIKIPLTPDFRPLQRGVIDSVTNVTNGEGIDAAYLGSQLFNYLSGDISTSVYDEKRTDEGRNPVGGMFTSALVPNLLRIGGNESLWDGSNQITEDMRNLPRNEQVFDSTSGAARALSQITGNQVTPIQADQILGLMGTFGRGVKTATDTKEEGGFNPLADLMRSFTPGKSMSDESKATSLYYDGVDQERYNIQDLKQRRLFEALHQKRTGAEALAKDLGIEVPEGQENTGMLDGATKALTLLSNEEVLQAEMNLTAQAKARGEPVNPLFDADALTPEQRNAILTYRQGKIYNSAGQNKDADGAGAFAALGLDEPWYQAFKDQENAFYNSLPGSEDGETTPRTFSGETKAVASPEVQAKLDTYYTLAKGTGDRSRFLRANPDVLDFWQKQEDFTNAERSALGFKPIGEDDEASSGSGGNSYSPYGVLGDMLNLGDQPGRIAAPSEKSYAKIDGELNAALNRLFGSKKGGRAAVTLGAESRGDV